MSSYFQKDFSDFSTNTICETWCFYTKLTLELLMTSSTYTVSDKAINIVFTKFVLLVDWEVNNRKYRNIPLCFTLWIRLNFDVSSFWTTSRTAQLDPTDRIFDQWRLFQTQMVSKKFENDCIKSGYLETHISVLPYNANAFSTVTMF